MYSGIYRLGEEELNEFFIDYTISNHETLINEYVLAEKQLYKFNGKEYTRVEYPIIENKWTGTVKPKNIEQQAALDMLLDENSTIKLISGTWGTGKTFLEIITALKLLEEGKFDKITWIRNNVQVANTDPIGSLPGSELDKILPYVMPMADHCGGIDGVLKLLESGKLEVIPLGFLRGRSIRNSIIISTEAENLTKEHIQLLIGRVDAGSNLWLDADTRQRDRIIFDKSKGVETLIERLKGNPLFGYVHLIKSERSKTASLADLLND